MINKGKDFKHELQHFLPKYTVLVDLFMITPLNVLSKGTLSNLDIFITLPLQ